METITRENNLEVLAEKCANISGNEKSMPQEFVFTFPNHSQRPLLNPVKYTQHPHPLWNSGQKETLTRNPALW